MSFARLALFLSAVALTASGVSAAPASSSGKLGAAGALPGTIGGAADLGAEWFGDIVVTGDTQVRRDLRIARERLAETLALSADDGDLRAQTLNRARARIEAAVNLEECLAAEQDDSTRVGIAGEIDDAAEDDLATFQAAFNESPEEDRARLRAQLADRERVARRIDAAFAGLNEEVPEESQSQRQAFANRTPSRLRMAVEEMERDAGDGENISIGAGAFRGDPEDAGSYAVASLDVDGDGKIDIGINGDRTIGMDINGDGEIDIDLDEEGQVGLRLAADGRVGLDADGDGRVDMDVRAGDILGLDLNADGKGDVNLDIMGVASLDASEDGSATLDLNGDGTADIDLASDRLEESSGTVDLDLNGDGIVDLDQNGDGTVDLDLDGDGTVDIGL